MTEDADMMGKSWKDGIVWDCDHREWWLGVSRYEEDHHYSEASQVSHLSVQF